MSDFIQSEQKAAQAADGVMDAPSTDLVPAEPGKPLGPTLAGRDGPVRVSLVAEQGHVYGGESVTLFAQVEARAPVAGFVVRIRIPAGMDVETYRAVDSDLMPVFEAGASPDILVDPRTLAPILAETSRYLVWHVTTAQTPGDRHEYEIQVRVNPALRGDTVRAQATVYVADTPVDQETTAIEVRERAAYLKYLPALYAQDEFMGRFLMLFESFWQPIEEQIDNAHYYLDPQLTPARFLPWLASWFRLSVESEEWTEAKQRALLSTIIWLYRKRGTKHALLEYLEILTGHPVEIVEHRAKDFRLGGSARLGVGIALGAGNVPHMFGVHLQLDPYPRPDGLDDDAWAKEQRRREEARRRLIEELIAHEKPAHTHFTVEYEVLAAADATEAKAEAEPEG
ncbi:MAG: phage tail protein [Litorilinea sp.]